MNENFTNNKGITLVTLVVTIIILIILAGVSINMSLGEGGIITIAKRAKENMELAQIEEQEQLNALYSQLEGETGEEIDYDIIAKLNNFKKAIADYIEEAGGIKPNYTGSAETFGERIKGIVAEVTKDATAEEPQILKNYTAYSKGKLRIGIMENQGAKTATINAGESYTIPEGYHNGNGKVIGASLAIQTQGTATEEDITEGKTAWVNGKKIQGTTKAIHVLEKGSFVTGTIGKGEVVGSTVNFQKNYTQEDNAWFCAYRVETISGDANCYFFIGGGATGATYNFTEIRGNSKTFYAWNSSGTTTGNLRVYYIIVNGV